MSESILFNLLHLDVYDEEERRKADAIAIIREARQNPRKLDLIYTFPHVVEIKRCCPLHQAIRLGLGVEVVDALSSPVALRLKCDGATALHLAMYPRFNGPMDIISHARPKIHVSWDVVSLLLRKHPDAARERDDEGQTPLHLACRYGAPHDVLSALLSSWPDAAREKDASGQTPLHSACEYKLPLSVLALFLSRCPDVAKEKDSDGSTLLHIICRYASLDQVSSILSACPDAAKVKDEDGWTPLHHACQEGAPFAVISLLMSSWPDAATEEDNDGLTPLHVACQYNESLDTIILLLDKWIEAKDNRNSESVECLIECTDIIDAPEEIGNLFFHVSALFDEDQFDPSPHEVMCFFNHLNWWNGALLVIDVYPSVTKALGLHTNVMADFLCIVGKKCCLTTMSTVIQNEPDILEWI
mmetsp:Transcript_23643/g.34380  ORF Transcript_23643/g.34380 Transcript_23643/m.34380 type:complete len:415 (-) Transcript_23643:2640-3884(-)